jgi:heme oxygenase
MSLRSILRAQTSDCHAEVDEIFGRFDLADPPAYGAFLSAHARAVPAVEMALEQAGIEALLPDWADRCRRQLLNDDLTALGILPPPLLPQPSFSTAAELWGAAYVLEGSKLGGAMLAKSVPADLPSGYLAPRGPKGGMKVFMDSLDSVDLSDPMEAVAAARAVFTLFRQAAMLEREMAVS